jgi:hypothetical protein
VGEEGRITLNSGREGKGREATIWAGTGWGRGQGHSHSVDEVGPPFTVVRSKSVGKGIGIPRVGTKRAVKYPAAGPAGPSARLHFTFTSCKREDRYGPDRDQLTDAVVDPELVRRYVHGYVTTRVSVRFTLDETSGDEIARMTTDIPILTRVETLVTVVVFTGVMDRSHATWFLVETRVRLPARSLINSLDATY